MKKFKDTAAELLSNALESLDNDQISQLLERPQKAEHGDIAFPCFQLAKILRKAPPMIAQEIAKNLQAKLATSPFQSIVAMGPYINFTLSNSTAWSFVEKVLEEKENYGKSGLGKGQKILIEYSSPNVAKELHIGHFRTTMLGQSLNNIFQASGHEVISVNHLGDWGSQFGKVTYAWLKNGLEADLEKNPISYLTKLYVDFHNESEKNPELDKEARLLFKKIEAGDPELSKIRNRFCELSIENLKRIYKRLNVEFQHYIGESFYFDKTNEVVETLRAKNLLVESEGAQVVMLEEYKMPPCLVLTGDGTTLYHTRDLAAAMYRKKHFEFDQCLYVVGSEQQLHFKQLFKVLELCEFPWANDLEHIKYGMYRFKDGKFSTRKGKVVLLMDVIDEAKNKVLEIIEQKNPDLKNKAETAEMVGFGAVVFNDLMTDRNKDVEFDWQRILDFEGDTGPYLQYTYARASSILRSAKNQNVVWNEKASISEAIKASKHAIYLMKEMGQFENHLLSAMRLKKPSIIAHYALDIARKFNSFYRDLKVLDDSANAEDIQARLLIVAATRQCLQNAMALICMQAPEEM